MKRFSMILVASILLAVTGLSQTNWRMDRAHTTIDFAVRYMMLSDVTGTYSEYDGTLSQVNEDFSDSIIEVRISSATINTRNNDRDNHLRSTDFFDSENHPDITFVSTGFHKLEDNKFKIPGTLTIREESHPVELDAELLGTITDAQGRERVAFTATTEIDRNNFGVQWNRALEAGGWLVGQMVTVNINAQFIKQ
jgi:polyisoprenoid-binding protein YceI